MLGQAPKTAPPTATGRPAPTATRAVPRLEWTDDSGPRTAVVERRCVLGSAPHCDIIIADQAVSRVHAEVEPREEGVWVRDLNSRNGTFVEGVRVESACVSHGFTVRVGVTDLLVNYATADHEPVESWPSDRFGPLVGRSQVMRELFATLARLAPTESSIMITGETGTGKELVARAIHQASMRAAGPFVVVDCATLSESLIEAELFGHVKGAFTGAHANRAGAIETADGGTVFLDEIGELPIGMQPKLLRVLESSTVRRIGEAKHRSVNVRFLTATHRDLLSMVNRGEFREDLYFRLAVLPVRVPSLRERLEDIELLLHHFSEGTRDWLTPSVLRSLEARPWRGNVRELRNFAERARAIGAAEALDLSAETTEREPITQVISRPSLPQPRSTMEPATPSSVVDASGGPSFAQPFRTFREQWIAHGERAFLRDLLERHGNNVAAASREAGIDRTHMYRLMRKHGL
ncbi:MAG: sigma 54-interacting transcriptional regulator [Myxococcales bacterium]|nr:sigma 54-interacting transcriptional regulator [Myxococcales bacterium]